MLTRQQIIDVLKKVTYKKGFQFRVRDDVRDCVEWIIETVVADSLAPHERVRVSKHVIFREVCNVRVIIDMVREAIIDLEMHEMYEWLRYDGQLVHNPHDS